MKIHDEVCVYDGCGTYELGINTKEDLGLKYKTANEAAKEDLGLKGLMK